ncbi:MAG: hypothetical protein F4117_14530 [Acidimicrobiales bacterium]|nr:hypothetical protein [Acidimicrobiaceae bacterium]MXX41530.1 hypothetical protein [Acidimicrobiales bacterium]MYD32984.1 hypothetical protein [Acidimicrobiales bacterium]MYI08537.1 hypothetical protein [Acidimicrobiales bacterium]MYI13765.1 hypothetical protein [Acidimicrobiales bacterium]
MNVQAILLGATVGVGATALIAGLQRRRADVPGGGAAAFRTNAYSEVSRRLGRLLSGDLSPSSQLGQNAAMVGRSLQTHALVKLWGLLAGIVLLLFAAIMMRVAGIASLPWLLIVPASAAGGLLGWWLPDSMLKTESDAERERFRQTAEAWLELVAQLVTAGSDAQSALTLAASYSDQPGFVAIRAAITEASARGEPPWAGLRRLADARRLPFLEPFVSALELAGTTGVGARRSILAQVEAVRSKTLSEVGAKAASASETMGAPLAIIGGAFMMLMGFPPLAGILNSDAIAAF